MSLENAELAKISVNTFVTMKITFANMLASLCEQIPGGDVDVVSDALGADRRIGREYLTGALGYGGPCFPRDNLALSYLADVLDCRADLAHTTDALNRSLAESIIRRVQPYIAKGATVAVLGLAYKPASHVIDESQGIHLAQALSQSGARVVAYDRLAGEAARAQLHHAIVLDSLADCLEQAEVILVTTPDPVFRGLSVQDVLAGKDSVTVVDFWRILDKTLSGNPRIQYVPIGRSTADAENTARLAELWDGDANSQLTSGPAVLTFLAPEPSRAIGADRGHS
jgi:UDPglucose 6-dehydrogenase